MAQLKNALKWPDIEQLGREFLDHAEAALQDFKSGAQELSPKALAGFALISAWLDSPCVATAKLDGTNLGVDNAGLIVGRNQIVQPNELYAKVDVYKKLASLPAKAAIARDEFAQAAGVSSSGIAQVMFYGELVINGKYDYEKAGIHNEWLCFGVVLRLEAPVVEDKERLREPQLTRCRCCVGLGSVQSYGLCPLCDGAGFHCEDDDPPEYRLSLALRVAGYNATPKTGKVLIAPNEILFSLLQRIRVPTVMHSYRPIHISDTDWTAHAGTGPLPRFHSMRALLASNWARRFLVPEDGVPRGEGLVVASESDGRLFKWKHAGEGLGKVPERLAEATMLLREWASSARANLLLPGLVEAFEQLLYVAQTKPHAGGTQKQEKKAKKDQAADAEALTVWESTLTKYDSLEAVFAKGPEAKAALEMEFIAQITADLEKDYEVGKDDASKRALRIVKSEFGKVWGTWLRKQKNCS